MTSRAQPCHWQPDIVCCKSKSLASNCFSHSLSRLEEYKYRHPKRNRTVHQLRCQSRSTRDRERSTNTSIQRTNCLILRSPKRIFRVPIKCHLDPLHLHHCLPANPHVARELSTVRPHIEDEHRTLAGDMHTRACHLLAVDIRDGLVH